MTRAFDVLVRLETIQVIFEGQGRRRKMVTSTEGFLVYFCLQCRLDTSILTLECTFFVSVKNMIINFHQH